MVNSKSGMVKKSIRILLLAAAALGLPRALLAAPPDSITVVADDNYPPYVFRDAEGQLRGILPDQWELWERKTGVKVDLKAMDWAEAQRVMREGGADVIDTIFQTPERARLYDFTPPYAQIKVPVFVDKDLGGISDLSSLRGFTVGVKAGDAVEGHLTNRGIGTLKTYPSYEAIIQAAKNDELQVFSVDEPAAIYYLYKHGIADRFRQSFLLYTGEFHRAVQKNRPGLLPLVQDGFKLISPREYQAIEQKWLGTPVAWTLALRRFAPLLALTAGIFLLLAAVNLFLQRQVRLRTAELRGSRARLENILRLAPVGICVVQRRTILEANAIFCNTLGFPPAEIVGKSTRMIYQSDDDYERYGREFYEQINRQGFVTVEIRTRRKDRRPLTILVSGAPLDPLRPGGEIVFTAIDITERENAAEELRKSHEYFASVFNSVNDALFIHDAATFQVLDVNRRMVELYGYSSFKEASAIFNQPPEGDPPFSKQEAFEWMRKARDEGPQTFEWLARRRDGHPFWVEICIRRVKIGSDDRLVVSARDISERKKAEQEKSRYERRMQEAQKLESLGLLAGGIAHDFNNLLTAILGNIDLALLDIPRNSTARDDLLTAMTATRRAAELAQQMLAYSGKGRFVIEPVHVPAAIQEIVQMLKASISKSADLRIRFPDSLPEIDADATQLRQVVMNLVINASEALEGRPGSIDLSAGIAEGQRLLPTRLWPHEPLPPGPYLYIEVADTGAGISPETLEKIFDPFFSTKFVGRGLGLCAVLGIVRGHKGAIQVDSAPGKGTTFRVFFPARTEPPSPSPAPPAEPPPPTGSGLLLLVDDEPSVRDTATKLLSRLGYQVLCAADGPQAIALFHGQAPRISGVILDLTMPQLDGVQTFAELRRIRADIPVIVSSGYSESEVMPRFAGMHLNGFIPKPYTLDGLRAALARCLSA